VDESAIAKRRYNRGRVVKEEWVLALIDANTKKSIVLYVEDRRAETLVGLIKKHVKTGTEVWTVMSQGYSSLQIEGLIHRTVNHS